ncbi:hypothetical protein RJ640_029011 [Escallonia rubra]|uniref:Uncharacterized protein n=1 Tax=Escallonia rubra TaxID=112253 RepID=A0AA88S0E8_9ASTE|nr:hypothetical protein RJ640_029011 [Escallonia rubra]
MTAFHSLVEFLEAETSLAGVCSQLVLWFPRIPFAFDTANEYISGVDYALTKKIDLIGKMPRVSAKWVRDIVPKGRLGLGN